MDVSQGPTWCVYESGHSLVLNPLRLVGGSTANGLILAMESAKMVIKGLKCLSKRSLTSVTVCQAVVFVHKMCIGSFSPGCVWTHIHDALLDYMCGEGHSMQRAGGMSTTQEQYLKLNRTSLILGDVGDASFRDLEAYEQLQMEKGYCSLTGGLKYTPQLLRERALAEPGATAALAARAVQMSVSLGSFFASLALDEALGRSELQSTVALRAKQLRWGSPSTTDRGCACEGELELLSIMSIL